MQWTHEQFGHQPWINKLVKGLSPTVLDFWGIKSNAQTIPVELYQQLAEGSIVSGNEAVTPGKEIKGYESDGSPIYGGEEEGIGTWSDVEAGSHPMFPGGTTTYYSDMAMDKFVPTSATGSDGSGGSGGGWGGYGGYGGGGGSGGGGGGGGYYESPSGMPRGNPNEAWGAQNPLLQAMIATHGGPGFKQGFHKGGIVTLVED